MCGGAGGNTFLFCDSITDKEMIEGSWGKGVKRPASMLSVVLEGQVQNMLLLMSGDVEKNPGPNSGR